MAFRPRSVFVGVATTALATLAPLAAWAVPGGAAHEPLIEPPPRVAPWHALPLIGGLIVVAAIMGRLVPQHRRRLRSSVLLLGVYLACLGLSHAFAALHWAEPAATAVWVASLFELLISINLAVLAFFEIGSRLVRYEPATIVSDLVIGAAYLVALLHTLHGAGVNLSGIVTTGAVVSGVLGFSLAPTLGNMFGGVAIQLDRSIAEGDWIQLDANTQGRVKAIRWRHTVVETRNWDTIIVPNSSLLSGNITILGKRTDQPAQRRYWIYFNVDYRHAPDEVIAAVNEALQAGPIPNVSAEPKPHCICYDFARDGRDSFGYYAVRYWLTNLAVDDPTNSAVRERIYAGLKRAGISLALPAQTVFVENDDPEHRERKRLREHTRRVSLLASLPMFREFTADELSHLAERLVFAPFARGEVMTQQGREAHWLYILAKGSAEIMVKVKDDHPPERVARIAATDFFGEMAVMTGEKRTATVIASEPSECYRLDKDAFRKIMTERRELAQIVSSVLAQRRAGLIATREHLTEQQVEERMKADSAHLIVAIERFFGLTAPVDGKPS
jgi:small-conductance mechanosensitive channel/CRP-like cAMP-binding protein